MKKMNMVVSAVLLLLVSTTGSWARPPLPRICTDIATCPGVQGPQGLRGPAGLSNVYFKTNDEQYMCWDNANHPFPSGYRGDWCVLPAALNGGGSFNPPPPPDCNPKDTIVAVVFPGVGFRVSMDFAKFSSKQVELLDQVRGGGPITGVQNPLNYVQSTVTRVTTCVKTSSVLP